MKKLTELTPEQEAMIIPHREMWLNKFYQNEGIDKELAIKQIKWLYNFCGQKEPVVVFMDSPLGSQMFISLVNNGEMANISANIWDNISDNIGGNISGNIGGNIGGNIRGNISDNIGGNISDNIGGNISDNIGGNISDNIGDNISDNIWDNIRGNISDNIGGNIRGNISDNIRDNIRGNIRGNIGDNISDNIGGNISGNIRGNISDNIGDNISDNIGGNYVNPCFYGDVTDYGWVAFWDYFQSLNHFVDFDWSKFDNFKMLLNSGIYEMITLDGLCVVCSMPKVIQDAENRLHSVSKPAVIFKDGFSMNYIHGVFIKDDMWSKLQDGTYSFEDWLKEENEEVKTACLAFMDEKHGSEYVYRFLSEHIKEVDNFVDKKDEKYLEGTTKGMNVGVYTLFKGSWGDIELAFVRCYCPSTDRMFFLSVDPVNFSARDAIASLYRIPDKVRGEIKYIQRQGERFSTVLTEKGNEIIASLPQHEIEKLVSISGEEYFSKMRYEY